MLITLLIGTNGYLFFSGSISFTQQERVQMEPTAIEQSPSLQSDVINANVKEMQGIAGVRNLESRNFAQTYQSYRSKYDLNKAHAPSGVRTLKQWCERIAGQIEKSDTFSTALVRSGLDSVQTSSLITALEDKLDFRTIRTGERFELWLSPRGEIERFTYRQSPLVSYLVEHISGNLVGQKISKATHTKTVPISVRIHDSLYTSLSEAGESPALVMMLVDIFAWDIDFYIDTHAGDTIRLLVEKEELDGEFIQYGRILAAEYHGLVGTHRAFRYQTRDGTDGYYDQQGNSLRKAFLKSPLKFTYISSGYGTRVHPILGFSKMHAGIDLAAPVGTPVWAPADGLVTFSGYKGYNGKLVVLRHVNGYETAFAHLHTISKSITNGTRVRQMQVLGTVGSTGLSTGPHLHYGMKKNGKNVNPFSQKFPPTDPVPGPELEEYKSAITPWLNQLERIPLATDRCTASVQADREENG